MRMWPAGWGYQPDLFDEVQAALLAELGGPHAIEEESDGPDDDDGGPAVVEGRLGGEHVTS